MKRQCLRKRTWRSSMYSDVKVGIPLTLQEEDAANWRGRKSPVSPDTLRLLAISWLAGTPTRERKWTYTMSYLTFFALLSYCCFRSSLLESFRSFISLFFLFFLLISITLVLFSSWRFYAHFGPRLWGILRLIDLLAVFLYNPWTERLKTRTTTQFWTGRQK